MEGTLTVRRAKFKFHAGVRCGKGPRKKDTRPWTLLNTWERSKYEPKDLEHCLFTACKELMEVTQMCRLSTTKSNPKDIGLWKHNTPRRRIGPPAKGKYSILCIGVLYPIGSGVIASSKFVGVKILSP